MNWRRIVLIVAVLALGVYWLAPRSGGAPEALTLRQAEKLTFYEGLPHQHFESDSLKAEKKAKPTIELHGFPFYEQLLQFKPGDEEKLKAMLADKGFCWLHHPGDGEPDCGGFHPDYALTWTAAGKSYEALLCLGCAEMRIYGPIGEVRYFMPSEPWRRLKELLKPYRQNRPPFQAPVL